MNPSYPKPFTILVAALTQSSDPSRGESGNPKVARGGFKLSMITTPQGNGRVGGPVQTPPAPSAASFTASIKIVNSDFWDPAVAPPAPLYLREEVALFDQYITASEEFGAGNGSGAGPTTAVATSLAKALNQYQDIKAVAVASDVYITSMSSNGTLPIKATDDMSTILGGVPFQIYMTGPTLLSVSPNYRKTFFVVKTVKTQSAPVELPPTSP